MAPKKKTPQIPKAPPAPNPGETVEEICTRYGKEQNETPQAFIERLVSALEDASRQCATLTLAVDDDDDEPRRDLGPVLSTGGALDAENQAVELVHYVSGKLAVRRGGSKGVGVLVDRPSWTKLRHRIDMLLGIPSAGPQEQPKLMQLPPTLAAAELRGRITDTALTAFKSASGSGTPKDFAIAAIRAVCYSLALELCRPGPVSIPTPPTQLPTPPKP